MELAPFTHSRIQFISGQTLCRQALHSYFSFPIQIIYHSYLSLKVENKSKAAFIMYDLVGGGRFFREVSKFSGKN